MEIVVADGAAVSRSERAMMAALRESAGVLLVGFLVSRGHQTRELDGIVLTRSGITVIEVKGTTRSGVLRFAANAPWTIDGQEWDVPGGVNPVHQARRGAQLLRQLCAESAIQTGFVDAVVAISGPVTLVGTGVGDTPVVPVAALGDVLAAGTGNRVSAGTVAQLLSIVGAPPIAAAVLQREGFRTSTQAPAAPGYAGKAQAKKVKRFAQMQSTAEKQWRSGNTRREAMCAVGTVASLLYLAFSNSLRVWVGGVLFFTVAALFQFIVRRRYSGQRTRGPLAVAGWLVTLGPMLGIGAAVMVIANASGSPSVENMFALNQSSLLLLGLALSMFSGRCSYVYPPPVVLERLNSRGEPTGAFMLANATPIRTAKHDWIPPSLFGATRTDDDPQRSQ